MRPIFAALLLTTAALIPTNTPAQTADNDGGTSVQLNARGQGEELLESIDIPPIVNAPFSLMLHIE